MPTSAFTPATETPSYRALALQTACHAVNNADSIAAGRSLIAAAIDRIHGQVVASKARIGPGLRLVVLPEYVLSGHPMTESLPEWAALGALEPDGPEYIRLGELSADADVYLCVNAYETDEHFPGIYFQACVILGPDGSAVLRYRRLNSMFSVTPHDVLDRYLEIYGAESLFPVARTEIGNLAAIASEEIQFPEVARCLAMRGAEVFLHSSSEVASELQSPKNIAKLARAIENGAYVVSANTAGLYGTALPAQSGDGSSKIIDHRGVVLAAALQGESMAANAEIDLGALRRFRRTPAMENLLPRQRYELYATSYARTCYPANTVPAEGVARSHFVATQRAVIEQLTEHNLI